MMQQSIFAATPLTADPLLAGLIHEDLGAGAWLDYLPRWVGGHEQLFDALVASVGWHQHRRQMYDRMVDVPRLTGSAPVPGHARHPFVDELSGYLAGHYGRPLSSISYAHYRDENDSVAMHGDKVGGLIEDCIVAIVAVGAPRRFLLREVKAAGARTFEFGWGDLLVMGGNAQRRWRHGIPKVARADPRISIMFRQSLASIAGQPPQA